MDSHVHYSSRCWHASWSAFPTWQRFGESGNWKLELWDWGLGTGDWGLGTGDRRAIGNDAASRSRELPACRFSAFSLIAATNATNSLWFVCQPASHCHEVLRFRFRCPLRHRNFTAFPAASDPIRWPVASHPVSGVGRRSPFSIRRSLGKCKKAARTLGEKI